MRGHGLAAFELLHEAQYDNDVEIGLAAKYLISQMMISWAGDSDPRPIRVLLEDYGTLGLSGRRGRIEMLASMPERMGLEALARLARFERSLALSRTAALAAIGTPSDYDHRDHQIRDAETIRRTVRGSRRVATSWLNTYADNLQSNDYDADAWRRLVDEEVVRLNHRTSDQLTDLSAMDLVQSAAELAIELDDFPAAEALVSEHLDLVPPQTARIREVTQWLVHRDMPTAVAQLETMHSGFFKRDPSLLYAAAEAAIAGGDVERGERLAAMAIELPPIPPPDQRDDLSDAELERRLRTHLVLALQLTQNGLVKWAEREYRLIIDAVDLGAYSTMSAYDYLTRLYIEQERFAEAAAVLHKVVDRMKRDREFNLQVRGRFSGLAELPSRYKFSLAQMVAPDQQYNLRLLGQPARTISGVAMRRALMADALEANMQDVDILIEMFRSSDLATADQRGESLIHRVNPSGDFDNMPDGFEVPRIPPDRKDWAALEDDQIWADYVQTRLRYHIQRAESEVASAERQGSSRTEYALNQYAWLVANTAGNYERALKYSLRSLDYDTDAAKLDTAARCHYALGQYDQAIAMQRRAIEMQPNSYPMERQLELFVRKRADAIAEQQSDSGDG